MLLRSFAIVMLVQAGCDYCNGIGGCARAQLQYGDAKEDPRIEWDS
jgi:hypothetical protein